LGEAAPSRRRRQIDDGLSLAPIDAGSALAAQHARLADSA
jgi:hypothetical protein